MTTVNKAIAKLNKKFPKINAVSTTEWDGRIGGIWFRQEGECHPDGNYYFDYWNMSEQVHPEVKKVLEEFGMFAEPNDPGTWFAWE
jgi:hypothetical protein